MSRFTLPSIILGGVALWLGLAYIPFWFHPTLPESGLFGDSFGMANAAFTGLGFLGVAFALYYQQKEITAGAALQRKQIELQETTTRLQKQLFDETRQRLAMETFGGVSRHVFRVVKDFGRLVTEQPVSARDLSEAMIDLMHHHTILRFMFGADSEKLIRAIELIRIDIEQWAQNGPPVESYKLLANRHSDIDREMSKLWNRLVDTQTY